MDIQKESSLRKIAKQVDENNKMLRKLHRSLMIGRIFRIIYWVLIIGIAVGAFYFLQPYYQGVLNLYNNVTDAQGEFAEISNFIFGQDLPPLEEDPATGAVE